MYWTYLYNPLSKLPSKPVLLIGIITSVIGAFISQFNQSIFDGLIDVHSFHTLSYAQAITANMINIIIPCIFLFILARIINPKTRMIDILNASFLYRLPIYSIPFLNALPLMKDIESKITAPITSLQDLQFSTEEIFSLIIFSCLSLAIITYAVTLLFFGFKTASNAKKMSHYFAFAGVFILCEILSKLLIYAIV